MNKICSNCNLDKSIDSFYKGKGYKDGYKKICKDCCKNKWGDRSQYYQDNKDKLIEKSKAYQIENKEAVNIKNKKWVAKNPDKRKAIVNKHEPKRLESLKERYYKDSKYRLKVSVSSLVRDRLKRRLSGKDGKSTFKDIMPYTVDDLYKHLESKFLPGMSWSNKSEWDIDHIRPDSSFNYTSINDDEFKKCWSLENLQPLWRIDNIRKGAKYEF